MSNYSKLTSDINQFIEERFPEVQCHIRHAAYEGIIHTFFLRVSSAKLLEEKWEPLFNAIAFHYQSRIESEFERWNFYIFYLVETPVDRSLKFKIENDPISSRKIVLDSFTEDLSDSVITGIIDEHITNRNLQFTVTAPGKSSKKHFAKNPILWKAMSQIAQTGKKKNADEDTNLILQSIETLLNNENQKG